MEIQNEFGEYASLLNNYIKDILNNKNEKIYDLSKSAFSRGKRIRGVFSLLSCEAVCGDWKKALPVATAFEFGHEASLVQDDIIDKSEERRGAPSMQRKYGIEKSILASDALIFDMFGILEKEYRNEVFLPKLFQSVVTCGKNVTEGEYLDMVYSEKDILDASKEEYLNMIRLRTGSLISSATECGGIVGNGSEEQCDYLKVFGENIGIAYQIKDDILDCFGEKTGKPLFQDLKNNRKNIFTVFVAEQCKEKDKNRFKEIAKESIDVDEIKEVQKFLTEIKAIDYAKRLSQDFIQEAKENINKLNQNAGIEKLLKFSEYLVDRTF